MLIRSTGRHDGVKNYLEEGRKKDRDQSRDQLDERVILFGDLEVTDAIIQSIQAAPEVERYLHVTLSFKEDNVALETLYAAVEDFRQFVYAAYTPDELNFYAEAHMPKLKSYADRKSGAPVERKPHVHIVIPKMNLISGGSADPFGYAKSNIRYFDAIQEQINARYGFASPKDNLRTQLTGSSEMIARYKGDLFGQSNRDLKNKLLNAVLDRKIETYDGFVSLLKEYGETRLRNVGRAGEYPNVKLPGDAKGINLKENVFSREFIALSTSDKLEQLRAESKPTYVAPGAQREPASLVDTTVTEWFAIRARETKYLNSGNKTAHQAYRRAAPEDRLRLLDERERAFYTKHLGVDHESRSTTASAENQRGDGRLRRIGRVYEFKRGSARTSEGVALAEPGPAESRSRERTGPDIERRRPSVADAKRWEWGASRGTSGASAKSLNGVRSLSSVPVVSFQRGSKVLLPNHASGVLEHPRAERPHALRRVRNSERSVASSVLRFERQYPSKSGAHFSAGRSYELHANKGMPAKRREAATRSSAHALRPDNAEVIDIRRDARAERWRAREARATGRVSDSVVSQHRRDNAEHRTRQAAAQHPEFAQIRKRLSARRLLGELSHSHGVLPEKYAVVRTQDGSERIKAGSRHLNVSDFLTKELNLPWNEAGPMLREAYARQQGEAIELPPRARPRVVLWQDYSQIRDGAVLARRTAWSDQRESEQRRRGSIKTDFDAKRQAIRINPDLSMRQRRSSLSLVRMERVGSETRLRETIALERATLQTKYGSAAGLSFGDYLQERAQQGNTLALSELRRTRRLHPKKTDETDEKKPKNEIRPIHAERNEIIYQRPALTHLVSDNGDVAYRRDGCDVVHDRGANVLVLQRDRDTIETGLRLAIAKYGSTLELAGDATFKREAATVAVDIGLKVRFSDDALNQLMTQTRAQRIADRYSNSSRGLVPPHSQDGAKMPTPDVGRTMTPKPNNSLENDPKPDMPSR